MCFLWYAIRQTETGSIVVTPFPGAIETKPGSATVPFFGIEPAILDAVSGKVGLDALFLNCNKKKLTRWQELIGNNVEGVLALKNPWPSIARTIYQDHKRYLETYMKVNMYCCSLYLILCWFISSLTLECSTRETELRVMSMDIFGLKDALMVRRSRFFFLDLTMIFFFEIRCH